MMRFRSRSALVVLCLTIGSGQVSAFAAALVEDPQRATTSPGMQLKPTATCPQHVLDELNETIEFVRGQSWTDQPGSNPLTIAPDLNACRVVLHVGHLTDAEEAALQAGAGSRLTIEYRRDWVRPSRSLLILWIVVGGSGVIWVYRRQGRR